MAHVSSTLLCCGLIFLSAPTASYAAETTASSVLGSSDLTPLPAQSKRTIHCAPGESLVGVGPNFTDRMVGVWFQCVRNDPDGRWIVDSEVTNFGPGQVRRSVSRWHECPRDYYIVSLAVTSGKYSADTHGMAKAVPAEILSDVQPLCRLPGSNPAFYQTPRAYFEQADDNSLRDTSARIPGDPHACPVGRVAVGILFEVDFGRDSDPESQFQDAALICDRLHVVPIKVLQGVIHH